MTTAPPTTGELIATKRLERKWTQPELAKRVGVHKNTVYKWEADDQEPSKRHRNALAELFGVTPRYFVT